MEAASRLWRKSKHFAAENRFSSSPIESDKPQSPEYQGAVCFLDFI